MFLKLLIKLSVCLSFSTFESSRSTSISSSSASTSFAFLIFSVKRMKSLLSRCFIMMSGSVLSLLLFVLLFLMLIFSVCVRASLYAASKMKKMKCLSEILMMCYVFVC